MSALFLVTVKLTRSSAHEGHRVMPDRARLAVHRRHRPAQDAPARPEHDPSRPDQTTTEETDDV